MRTAVALTLLVAVAVWTYAPVRTASFVYEDANAVWQHPGVLGAAPIDVGRARWLTALSHRLVFLVSHQPAASHLANVGLHIANGLLVYLLAALWLSPAAAALASAVFLLHPIQTEAVAYVASRSELLSTLLGLLALYVGVGDRRWWRSIAMWTLVLAAVCAKESIVVIVPIAALVDVFQGRRLSWWRLSWLAVPALAMAVSVLRFDFAARTDKGPLAYVLLQATAVWRYVALIVVPRGQSIDHDFVIVAPAVQALALAALVVVVGLAVAAFVLSGTLSGRVSTLRVAAFGVIWAIVALLPRFAVQIPEMLNEHQMYFPMVGLSLALAAVLAPSAIREPMQPHTTGTFGMTPTVNTLELDWM